MDKIDQVLAQDMGGESIEHHGVKGQKWGVRRRRISGTAKQVAATAMSVGGLAGMALSKGKEGRSTFEAGLALYRSANHDFRKSDKLEKKYAKRAKRIAKVKKTMSRKMSEVKSKPAARKISKSIAKKAAKLERAKSMKISAIKSKIASKKAAKSAMSASKSREKDWNKMYTNRSNISTPELREKVNRLTLENQLRQQASIANPAKKSAARKIITNAGTELLRNVVQQAGQQVLKQALKKVPV